MAQHVRRYVFRARHPVLRTWAPLKALGHRGHHFVREGYSTVRQRPNL